MHISNAIKRTHQYRPNSCSHIQQNVGQAYVKEQRDTIRYDTIEEFNVDSKAEYD